MGSTEILHLVYVVELLDREKKETSRSCPALFVMKLKELIVIIVEEEVPFISLIHIMFFVLISQIFILWSMALNFLTRSYLNNEYIGKIMLELTQLQPYILHVLLLELRS